jgi:hypothetical protein
LTFSGQSLTFRVAADGLPLCVAQTPCHHDQFLLLRLVTWCPPEAWRTALVAPEPGLQTFDGLVALLKSLVQLLHLPLVLLNGCFQSSNRVAAEPGKRSLDAVKNRQLFDPHFYGSSLVKLRNGFWVRVQTKYNIYKITQVP